jgi:tetratricopeptide (TPR) repeat protein
MSEPATSAQLLQQGLFHHRQGDLAQAMERYVEVLRNDPQNPDALYYVAVVACQEEQFQQGIELARRAIEFGPPQARVHNLLGQALYREGDRLEAIKCFDRAIALDPKFADAHGNRANILADAGFPDEALKSFDRALALNPASAADWLNRGSVLQGLGRHDEALRSFDKALALAPDMAVAHYNRAGALRDTDRMEEALAAFARAAQLRPDIAEFHNNYALALSHFYRHAEALETINRAAQLNPNEVSHVINRGHILRRLGRYDEAEADYARALAVNPQLSQPHLGRAHILIENARYMDARRAAELACQLDPQAPEPKNTLAFLQLIHGDWEQGWKNYESRSRTLRPAYYPLPYRRWNGEPLADERLVVMTEQGMGDAIQFSRLAPMLAERGLEVTVLTVPPLAALLSSLPSVKTITSIDAVKDEARPFCWVPMMSLPGILGLRPSTIPAEVPYLSAEPARVTDWSNRLGGGGFKIGICWRSGHQMNLITRTRDIPLRDFAPLTEIPGARLITLQLGPGLEELNQVDFRDRIENISDALHDWADTAALMMNLDLIVTCDTAVPHLAGALARPTLVALPSVACWRWQIDREDTPWYPTMQLFRQQAPDQWGPVLERIAADVTARAAKSAQTIS